VDWYIELPMLFAAALTAGAINAVAGGGSLISFPALIAAGYPSKVANVTNTVSLWPGYAGGSLAYRRGLGHQKRRVIALTLPSVVGALVGSVILLSTPQSTFDLVVPWLILFACGLMVVQGKLGAWAVSKRLTPNDSEHVPLLLHLSVFVLAMYGAYFGAGLGILTLAVLSILLPDDLQSSNALKGMLSLVINAAAVVYFAAFGPVEWAPAGIMAVGAVLGGFVGVGIARKLNRFWLRTAVVSYGVVVALVLLAR
jgi:uncharacterized protein